MNTEDFVTYKQAVKLKECGFNWETFKYYKVGNTHTLYDSAGKRDFIPAPTLSQAIKWLREKKKLSIEITSISDQVIEKHKLVRRLFWDVGLIDISKDIPVVIKYLHGRFKTYKALSAGIDAALELIKEERNGNKRNKDNPS